MQSLPVATKSSIVGLLAVLFFLLCPKSAFAIVGGDEMQAEWMVAVALADEANGYRAQFCGGTLIDEEWILTAAHCMYDVAGELYVAEELDVIVGRTDLTSENGERIAVAEIIVHQDFNFATYHADVALLRLTEAASAPHVQLALGADAVPTATVLGWGVTEDSYASELLLGVEVPLVSTDECRKVYATMGYPVTSTMTCAGYEFGSMDSCTGDSGGPLVNIDEKGNAVQIGIVSWGVGCGQAGTYGVYTNVTTIQEWIQNQVLSAN